MASMFPLLVARQVPTKGNRDWGGRGEISVDRKTKMSAASVVIIAAVGGESRYSVKIKG